MMTIPERLAQKEAELGVLFSSRQRLEMQAQSVQQQIQSHEIELIRVDGEVRLLRELQAAEKAG